MVRAVHAGKAAVAGLALPVAVGLEIIAVPGSGWYALYQVRGGMSPEGPPAAAG